MPGPRRPAPGCRRRRRPSASRRRPRGWRRGAASSAPSRPPSPAAGSRREARARGSPRRRRRGCRWCRRAAAPSRPVAHRGWSSAARPRGRPRRATAAGGPGGRPRRRGRRPRRGSRVPERIRRGGRSARGPRAPARGPRRAGRPGGPRRAVVMRRDRAVPVASRSAVRDDPVQLARPGVVERLGVVLGEDPGRLRAGGVDRVDRRPVGRRLPGERGEAPPAQLVPRVPLVEVVPLRPDALDDVEGQRLATRVERGERAADALVEVRVEDELLRREERARLEEAHPGPGLRSGEGVEREGHRRLGGGLPAGRPRVGAVDAGEGRDAPGVGQLHADDVGDLVLPRRGEVGPAARLHHPGHEGVEDRRARVDELDQRQRGDDLRVAGHDRAGDRRRPRGAGRGHRHEADRDAGLGEDEGTLHPLVVLGQGRDRADERREGRSRPHASPRRRRGRVPSPRRTGPAAPPSPSRSGRASRCSGTRRGARGAGPWPGGPGRSASASRSRPPAARRRGGPPAPRRPSRRPAGCRPARAPRCRTRRSPRRAPSRRGRGRSPGRGRP